jgi:multicomponent Na+:H+ antiporter subunit D
MQPLLFPDAIAPSLLLIFGALLLPLFHGRVHQAWRLGLPLLALLLFVRMPAGDHWVYPLLDYPLVLGRIDALSRVFGIIFSIMAFIGVVYALKVDDNVQHVAGLVYAGGALGVTLAGDWFSLYLFWETMAVASTFLILARRTRRSRQAAMRYILVHVFGGLALLAGIVLLAGTGADLSVRALRLDSLPSALIFLGIAVNAAVPPLHAWLQDAYPEATVAGAVFLSAFTTKSAVYVMARTFAGTEALIWLGAVMTILPVFYAEVENDIRRVLSYSLMNQVGFMLCGIGIGTELAINGAVSHAFCHILYKSLLFMSAGAVLHVTGKITCTDIGGLYRTMPVTCALCIVGAASISAFPLFSGFVSKSMIISAAGINGLGAIWLMLQFASAGVIAHAGIKVPFFTFFGHDAGLKAHEPPLNMLIAMGLAAFGCIFIGVYPQPLYALLPYPVDYVPYIGSHVVGQLQLLLFAIFAFYLLLKSGYYPSEVRAINLDADWFYRKGATGFYRLVDSGFNGLNRWCDRHLVQAAAQKAARFAADGPARLMAALLRVVGQPLPVQRAFETGTVRLGVHAATAALFMVVVYLIA